MEISPNQIAFKVGKVCIEEPKTLLTCESFCSH